jgi:hypothetical protein
MESASPLPDPLKSLDRLGETRELIHAGVDGVRLIDDLAAEASFSFVFMLLPFAGRWL